MATYTSIRVMKTTPGDSTRKKTSLAGRSFKKCGRCHAQANSNAQKSCKLCGHVFPCKLRSTNTQTTRRGRSFKCCGACGTMAKSNRQRACGNTACGRVFPTGRAGTAAASGKRRFAETVSGHVELRVQKKLKREAEDEDSEEFDQFMAMLNDFNKEPKPYVEKAIAQEQQVLLDSAVDSDVLPEVLAPVFPEVPASPGASSNEAVAPTLEIESFDSILNQALTDRAVAEVEAWERELLDSINDQWLDEQLSTTHMSTLPPVMVSPAIMV